MTVHIEFKDVLGADLVVFGLANSGQVSGWRCEPPEQLLIDALDQVPWGSQPPDTGQPVRQVGALLREKLESLHAVRNALINNFAGGDQVVTPRPLYFRLSSPAVEAVPFEAVWEPTAGLFACLDSRWPVARLPADASEPPGPFTMARTIRVVAVLAAEGEDATAQLNAVRAAVQAHPELAVELLVLTSDTAMTGTINAAADPNWTAELVPATEDELITRIREAQPHLLHIFCHGTAAGPRLLVAQRDDLAVLELTAAHFAEVARPVAVAPWLVTLNCCESAAPDPTGGQVGSLASALVRAGLPAVVGMRKPVSKAMADGFCADLYRAVFARLAEIAPVGNRICDLDWASVLAEPRRRLCAAHGAVGDVAGRQKEWTMPILYLATPNLKLRGRPTAALTDASINRELTTLSLADTLEKAGNLTPENAATLRAPALAALYPAG